MSNGIRYAIIKGITKTCQTRFYVVTIAPDENPMEGEIYMDRDHAEDKAFSLNNAQRLIETFPLSYQETVNPAKPRLSPFPS